jgi:hypothetical protein
MSIESAHEAGQKQKETPLIYFRGVFVLSRIAISREQS